MRSNKSILFVIFFVILLCGFVSIFGLISDDFQQSSPPVFQSPYTIIRPPTDVQALAIDESGDLIWAGGKDGVFHINRKTKELVPIPSCLQNITYVRDILIENDKSVWISSNNGLYHYLNNNCFSFTTTNGLSDNMVFCLMADRSGKIHAGTMKGTVVIENGQITGYEKDMQNPIVFTMKEDDWGGIWYGSYASQGGGVSINTGGNWQFFGLKDGLPHQAITSMLMADDGSFWVGMGVDDRGGAVRFIRDGTSWVIERIYSKKDGLAGEKVRSLFQDSSGVIWIGSEFDGIVRYVNGTFYRYTEQDGLSDNEIIDIIQDLDGDVWLGTMNGITVISSKLVSDDPIISEYTNIG